MITLKTINTIELSSDCNLACSYCVNRLMKKNSRRKIGIMSDEIFNKSLELLKELVKRGTQEEVNLNGNGESTLDPQLEHRIRAVKEIVGDRQVGLCTNGLTMNPMLARSLKKAGLDRCDVSIHSPKHARRAVQDLFTAGMKGVLAAGAIVAPHNWAGQLEPENSVTLRLECPCDPLIEGRGYISSEGFISPCCYDYQLIGAYAHVSESMEIIMKSRLFRYSICETCHQKIPESTRKETRTNKELAKDLNKLCESTL